MCRRHVPIRANFSGRDQGRRQGEDGCAVELSRGRPSVIDDRKESGLRSAVRRQEPLVFKTSASTWHCAFYCSQAAAPLDLAEWDKHTRWALTFTKHKHDLVDPKNSFEQTKTKTPTHQQLQQQDTYHRYIWCRPHAPSWGWQPGGSDAEGRSE